MAACDLFQHAWDTCTTWNVAHQIQEICKINSHTRQEVTGMTNFNMVCDGRV